MSAALDRAGLREWLIGRVAQALGVAPGEVDTTEPLRDIGLSSRELTSVGGDLARTLGRPLPPALVWEHPTIDEMATALTAPGPAAAAAPTPARVGTDAPVAVVGLGCRLPGGVDSPAAFARLLAEGRDAVGTVPPERWEAFAAAEELAGLPRHGGFLDDALGFDADFFGIMAREAATMDPQQRVLLEVAWEALEHAGIPPATLRGTRTGVFVGLSATEYGRLTMADVRAVEPWAGTGASAALTANRLSYAFDLRGPSVAVDTACSSSLVALHQAVVALQRGECDTAIVAGVNLQLSPAITAAFGQLGALAADGRCKPFSAGADGIGRGEGCGVVVLRPLPAARRARDRVLAVVRGSAVNSDGRSNGITAPNPRAQQDLLRQACATAGLSPASLDYVEAHGTGTPLGDPIEAAALGAVLGAGRDDDRPLLIGSVKSNLGHLEGAAGIVGFIKVVLAMGARMLPATLHHDAPHPDIDFAGLGLRVVDRPTAWPRYSGIARAGVSAFGFGGTNAHVVVEEWPAAAPPVRDDARPHAFALSAVSAAAVAARAGDLAGWLDSEPGRGAALGAVAATLATRREHLAARAVVIAPDRSALVGALTELAAGGRPDGVVAGTATPAPGAGPVLVFSGYGSQWAGMGAELLATEPAFRAEIEALDPVFRAVAGFDLLATVDTDEPPPDFASTQLALLGIQLAQAALWRAHGVRPAAVIGHSMGEVAAAVVAGALDAADGVRVMATRARLLDGIDASGAGAMAMVEGSAAELDALTDRFPGVAVAVYGSPTQHTVSGPAGQVAALVEHVEQAGGLARRLPVAVAGHSPAVDPLLDPLRAGLDGLAPRPSQVPCYSTVLDDPRTPSAFDVEHWVAGLRRPVRLHQALAAAVADGHRVFVELAPHPIAASSIQETGGAAVLVVPTAHRKAGEQRTFLTSLARLHVWGYPDVLGARSPAGPPVELPGPRWEHRRFWPAAVHRSAAPGAHPLLGAHVDLPGAGERHAWRGDVGTRTHPWLADHTVRGIAVLPGTAYLELALAAGPGRQVRDLDLLAVLALTPGTVVTTTLDTPEGGGDGRFTVSSRAASGGWTCHATARLTQPGTPTTQPGAPMVQPGSSTTRPGSPPVPIGAVPAAEGTPLDLYAAMAAAGQHYGPAFRRLSGVVTAPGRASARITPPDVDDPGFVLHPALADACLHALAAASGLLGSGRETWLPWAIGAVTVLGDPRRGVRVDALVTFSGAPGSGPTGSGPTGSGTADLTGDVQLVDADGAVLVDIVEVHVRRTARAALPVPLADTLFTTRWERTDPDPDPAPSPDGGSVLLLADDGADTAGLPGVVRPLGDPDALRRRILDGPRPDAVVVLVAGDPGPEDARDIVGRIVAAVAVLVAAGSTPRLLLVTEGAQVVRSGEAGRPGAAALRALVRVLAFEHPELRAALVDLDPGPGRAAALRAELAAPGAGPVEDEVAWRAGIRYARRLTRAVPDPAGAGPVAGPGAYLITGGLGGLGLVAARRLAELGATRLVLAGRSGPTPATERALAGLRELGADVVVVTGDVAAPGHAEHLVGVASRDGMRLRGVLHAAAVITDGAVSGLTDDGLADAWWAKAVGAHALHRATRGAELDWWLVYSSAAALFGSPGQAAYATANAYTDALVERRRAEGLPATSIQWGAWGEVGSAVGSDNPLLEPLGTAQAVEALELVLSTGPATVGVARLDIRTVLALYPELARRPFLGLLVDPVPAEPETAPDWPGMAAVRELGAAAAAAAVTEHLVAVMAGLMGAGSIDRDRPLTDLGLDSLLAVRARTAVERDFGLALPMPLMLRGASLAEVAAALVEQAGFGPAPARVAAPLGPRDPAERWVARRWAEVLDDPVTGVHDDFRGDADAAQRLRTAVTAEFGAAPEDLFAVPTVAAMADLLRDRIEGTGDGPRRVLRAGTGDPVFLFHPAGGPTSVYRDLVARLSGGYPVYGLERFTDVPSADVQSVPERAARYVELIREVRPHGPYRLAGWSFGGCLAYETARQLEAGGEPVAVVAMIDTILPLPDDGDLGELLHARFTRFAEHVGETYGVPLTVPTGDLAVLDDEAQIDAMLDQLPQMGAGVLQHQRTSYLDARAAERYAPATWPGRAVLLRAADPHPLTTALDPRYRRTDDDLGWAEHCPALQVVHIPGDHLSMIDPPHVTELAAALDAALGSMEVR